jgi:hypothetical protein
LRTQGRTGILQSKIPANPLRMGRWRLPSAIARGLFLSYRVRAACTRNSGTRRREMGRPPWGLPRQSPRGPKFSGRPENLLWALCAARKGPPHPWWRQPEPESRRAAWRPGQLWQFAPRKLPPPPFTHGRLPTAIARGLFLSCRLLDIP